MTANLRPMSLGEILDRTFLIYRSRVRLFLGMGAMPVLATLAILAVGLILDGLLSQTTLTPGDKNSIESAAGHLGVDGWKSLFGYLVWPVVIFTASQLHFGQEAAFRPAFARCLARWKSWLLLSVVLWAVSNGIPALVHAIPILTRARMNAMLVLMQGLGSIAQWPRSLFYLALGWGLGLAAGAALWIIVPVWILEDTPLRPAIGRNLALLKGGYGRILVASGLILALQWILQVSASFVVMFLFRMLISMLPGPHFYFSIYRVITAIPVITAEIVVAALLPIALTLFYYDQRVRREGFDIELKMEAAGMNAPVATTELPVGAESEERPA